MNKRCTLFANWIENNGLIDLGFLGPRFTWVRGNTCDTCKSAKLDGALCNTSWRPRFPEGSVQHLIWCYSDHYSVLISPNGFAPVSKNAKPFQFKVAWTAHTQFEEFLKSQGKENLPLVPSLGYLAKDLMKWNKEAFGNLFLKKKENLGPIRRSAKITRSEWSRHLMKLEARPRKELEEIHYQIELLWFQKSQVDAIRDSDRNTRYFHSCTVVKYFANLFIDPLSENNANDLAQDGFPHLSQEMYTYLAKPFSLSAVSYTHLTLPTKRIV